MQVYNYDEGGESRERVIVDVDNFNPKPLHVDEAAMQLEQRGGEFLVFLEAESEKVNVLYKQKDGNYGLIAPGV